MTLVKITPRLRMFAGPNGSGKSTIKAELKPEWLGFYINPDEIEAEITKLGFFDFSRFQIQISDKELFEFFQNSTLLKNAEMLNDSEKIEVGKNRINFAKIEVNSYYASVISDLIRQSLIKSNQSFSFETVMSSPDKVELLAKTLRFGYRNYLYYVATDSPQINISRVEVRVKEGGHNVANDKIESRYYRSLDFLLNAVKLTNRAYIFDNSGNKSVLIAEITDGKRIEIKRSRIPLWFKKYVLDKI
jgi:predicted ABC-type ATPase